MNARLLYWVTMFNSWHSRHKHENFNHIFVWLVWDFPDMNSCPPGQTEVTTCLTWCRLLIFVALLLNLTRRHHVLNSSENSEKMQTTEEVVTVFVLYFAPPILSSSHWHLASGCSLMGLKLSYQCSLQIYCFSRSQNYVRWLEIVAPVKSVVAQLNEIRCSKRKRQQIAPFSFNMNCVTVVGSL